MFYGGHGLHGASSNQHEFLMIDPEEKYDIAHFEFVMRGVQDAITRFPDKKDDISLSLHCETAEIMAAYTKMVQEENKLSGAVWFVLLLNKSIFPLPGYPNGIS